MTVEPVLPAGLPSAAIPAGRGRIPLARGRAGARRALVPFAILAVSAHVIGAAGLIEAPRIARVLFGAPPPPRVPGPPPEATIALIEENTPTVGGSRPMKAARPDAKPTDAPHGKPPPDPISSPLAADHVATASGTQAGENAPAAKAAAPQTTPAPPSQSAPEVNLDADGDPGTGIVSGPNVVPASPSDSQINTPPSYPRAAAMRREQGSVGLIVSIAPDGRAAAVDIASSSGYTALDDAARRAVARWHFRPATEDGKPVPSVFNEQIEFTLEPRPP